MITNATYDMTNLATLKDWSLFITVMDISRGSFLCGIISLIVFMIMSKGQEQRASKRV